MDGRRSTRYAVEVTLAALLAAGCSPAPAATPGAGTSPPGKQMSTVTSRPPTAAASAPTSGSPTAAASAPTSGSPTAAASAATSGPPTASSSAATPRDLSVVALGDSVPSGGGCKCTPYPQLSGDDLASPPDRAVTVGNDAVGGYTTSDVLAQLRSDPSVKDDVRAADIVEIEVGANDVGYSSSCGTTVACYQPTVPVVKENLDAIVARVHELTSGHAVLVVLLDYWSVWLGGQYAAAKGDAYVAAAAEVTDQVNTVIRSTASTTGSAYVDLRTAFKGPNYAYDETHYLAPDGDHPNAAGHQRIADAAVTEIETALHM